MINVVHFHTFIQRTERVNEGVLEYMCSRWVLALENRSVLEEMQQCSCW